ncbi:MAG: sulfotransferase, partial [Pirellulales bacterium]|nr:sulfotransferase [Pirellulales bacterium]
MGNKRSGSTLLVNMLNEHPEVCVTHESDIIWTLYQCRHGMPKQFRSFELDAPRG